MVCALGATPLPADYFLFFLLPLRSAQHRSTIFTPRTVCRVAFNLGATLFEPYNIVVTCARLHLSQYRRNFDDHIYCSPYVCGAAGRLSH